MSVRSNAQRIDFNSTMIRAMKVDRNRNGLTYAEIAEKWGISVPTVKKYVG